LRIVKNWSEISRNNGDWQTQLENLEMTDPKPSFWSTLPGILTAVAAVLGAIATLLTAMYSSGLLGNKAPTSPATSTVVPHAETAAATAAEESFPETQEVLRKYFEQMMDATEVGNLSFAKTLARDMIIPNHKRWFAENFGREAGERLDVDYSIIIKSADTPEGLFNIPKLLERPRTPILVERITDPGDTNATGLQRKALLARKKDFALYTVEVRGFSIWSFVYVDGAFRIAGKMQSIE
jgi:hypothetical protein